MALQEIQMNPPAGGGGGGGQGQSPVASTEPAFYRWYHKFQALWEASESVSWETIFMQSWANSTLDIYQRHLKILRARHLQSPSESPILVLKEYVLALYGTQQTSSDMRQAISACRLLEEAEIGDGVIPRSIWRVVRAKDKVTHLAARG